jgi:hypothetical protein
MGPPLWDEEVERRKWVPFIDRPDASPPRDCVLTEIEIVWFWHACDKVGRTDGAGAEIAAADRLQAH